MTDFEIREYHNYCESEVLPIYQSVGWTNYTRNPEMLKKAFGGSLCVLGGYHNGTLVGLIRLVGDGASILYIQDLLVKPEHQKKGLGSALLNAALKKYPDVYQTVLMTDNTAETCAFYKSNEFFAVSDINVSGFMKISGIN